MSDPRAVRKAVIPAAGFGTRFLPATKAVPKEMLAVVDTPLIQFAVEEAAAAGITDIAIITRGGKTAIEDHFCGSTDLARFLEDRGQTDRLEEIRRVESLAFFHFIDQPDPLGLGDAVLRAESFVGEEPFAVLLPDDIFIGPVPCIRQLMDVYEERRTPVIVLERTDAEGTRKYGIVKARPLSERLFEVRDLVEKPGPEQAFSDLAAVGRYVFTPAIFDALRDTGPDERGEVQVTDAIAALCRRGPVHGLLYEGRKYDAGDKRGFLEATIALALERPEFAGLIESVLKRRGG